MNVVKEINKINQRELELGVSGSWHDEYKDSAYIFVGGLHTELTEGDVITIFSQYGEVMDVNLPRDKETGKTRGFGFLMYEDQRSTILAVDNLNGARVLERTLRVDHVKNYKQAKIKNENGEWIEPEEQSLNAKPEMVIDGEPGSDSETSSANDLDPDDPMRDYLLAKRKEEKALKKHKKPKPKSKSKHKDETAEERRARKARRKEKRARKEKSEGMKAVENLLSSLDRRREPEDQSHFSSPRTRNHSWSRSRSPAADPGHPTRDHSRRHSRSPDTRSRRPMLSDERRKHDSRYEDEARSRRYRNHD